MKNAKQTVIVFDNVTDRDHSFQMFSQIGFHQLLKINTRDELRHVIDNDSDQLLLVAFPDLPLPLIVANIRSVLGLGGLIAVKDPTSSLTVSELLIAGADAVVDATDNSFTELLAWHTALKRRVEALIRSTTLADNKVQTQVDIAGVIDKSPQSMTWSLVDGGWTLLSPTQEKITLTYGEKFFLACFVGEADKRVSREQLLGLNAIQNQSSRAIDSLVSRLRKKAADSGFSLPIKSVHGWGYSFIGVLSYCNEGVGKKRGTDSASFDLAYMELETKADVLEQLQAGRFFFKFDTILDNNTGDYYGAIAHLCWNSSRGEQVAVESFSHHLETLDALPELCRWSIATLGQEMQQWKRDYEFDLPIVLPWSASLLPDVVTVMQEEFVRLDVHKKLIVLVHGVNELLNQSMLQVVFGYIQKAGGEVWLRFEERMSQYNIGILDWVSGVSFMLDTSLLVSGEKHVEHVPFVAHTRRLGLPMLCEGVDSVEQKEFSLAIGAKYITGGYVALPLCKDGLLLAWASQAGAAS